MLLDSQIRLLAHGKAQGSVILSLGNDESDTTVNFGIQKSTRRYGILYFLRKPFFDFGIMEPGKNRRG